MIELIHLIIRLIEYLSSDSEKKKARDPASAWQASQAEWERQRREWEARQGGPPPVPAAPPPVGQGTAVWRSTVPGRPPIPFGPPAALARPPAPVSPAPKAKKKSQRRPAPAKVRAPSVPFDELVSRSSRPRQRGSSQLVATGRPAELKAQFVLSEVMRPPLSLRRP